MEHVAVINRSEFTIYRVLKSGRFVRMGGFLNPLQRVRDRELRRQSVREMRPTENSDRQFAKHVATEINSTLAADANLTLKLVCEDRFLGYMRPSLDSKYEDRISFVKKDIAKLPRSKWPELLAV